MINTEFISTEVVAGVFLGLYFILKGIASSNAKLRNVDQTQMTEDLKEIKDQLKAWEVKINRGEFSSPWNQREVQIVLDKLDRILNELQNK